MSSRDYISLLLESKECTGACLLAQGNEACDCRCRGTHHGKGLEALESHGDVLVGMHFHAMPTCEHCEQRYPKFSGQVLSIVRQDLYLCARHNAPESNLVSIDDMAEWIFYPTYDDLSEHWEYGGLGRVFEVHHDKCYAPRHPID